MDNKKLDKINPLKIAFRVSLLYFITANLGIYLTDKFILGFYPDFSNFPTDIKILRPYIFTIFNALLLLYLAYRSISKIKEYETTINSNFKEIHKREIDLFNLESKIDNQKYLIDNIIRSASILIVTLDKNFNIRDIDGDLNLFPNLSHKDILGEKLDILFEDNIDLKKIRDKKINNIELKLCSDSDEDRYGLMTLNLKQNYIIKRTEYTALIIDITQRKILEDQIHYLDYYDPITDLPNRILLEIKYRGLRKKTDFKKNSIAFIYIDIDDFKHINDSISHYAGDEFLIYISNLLQNSISKDDILARITQDEFAIISSDIKSKADIECIVNKIYEKIELPWIFDGIEFSIGLTIGVSTSPKDGDDFHLLLKNAHLTSQYVKNRDKGNYKYYSKNLEQDVLQDIDTMNELKGAIKRDEFTLYYQTVANLKTQKVEGVEALVRWIHPEKGLIPPIDFIPVVENTALTYDLLDIIVNKALKQKRDWNLEGTNVPKISINISSKSFSQENFGEFIEETISKYNLDNSEVILELTESGFTGNIEAIETNINHLRDIGVEIAMDDFGTGYSTLSRLKIIPIDYLKLDKIFIDKITERNEEEIMVKAVISLANAFNLKVVAEGIETKEQFMLLNDLGCSLGQGYYISKPKPVEKLNI